jgi:hypothetical protein
VDGELLVDDFRLVHEDVPAIVATACAEAAALAKRAF